MFREVRTRRYKMYNKMRDLSKKRQRYVSVPSKTGLCEGAFVEVSPRLEDRHLHGHNERICGKDKEF